MKVLNNFFTEKGRLLPLLVLTLSMFVPCISRGEPVTRQYNENLEAIEGTKVGNWRDRSTAALEHIISNTAPALLSA